MTNTYYTRALQAKDPRYKLILDKLGYGTREVVPAAAIEKPTKKEKQKRKRGRKKADPEPEMTVNEQREELGMSLVETPDESEIYKPDQDEE